MAVESHDKKLDDLLKMVEDGKAQLPDFQRSWVWDDTKICKLIESITSGFPRQSNGRHGDRYLSHICTSGNRTRNRNVIRIWQTKYEQRDTIYIIPVA